MHFLLFTLGLLFTSQAVAEDISDAILENVKTSTVFIARYRDLRLDGWGSGFFVDEGVIVTNKHVINPIGDYRVYATKNDEVDQDCWKDVPKSNMRISLENDIAYIRVFLDCDHGVVQFAKEDAEVNTLTGVIGYPWRGSLESSMKLSLTGGVVLGKATESRTATTVQLQPGNSGGPMIQAGRVIGVAVARTAVDPRTGKSLGFFVPVSLIKEGLEYGNDSNFGYTPQEEQESELYDQFDEYSDISFQSSANSSKSSDPTYAKPASSADRASVGRQQSSISNLLSPIFSDVSSRFYAYESIKLLKDAGVIGGYSDGTYRPHNPVNRAELLKILVEGFYPEEVRGEVGCFPDVSRQWFAAYVCAAKRLGWVGGYPDGTFRPGNSVNRAEAIKIVASSLISSGSTGQILPYDVQESAWYAPYVGLAIHRDILKLNKPFRADQDLTRADAAQWIASGLES